ncbi:hypothetical protein CEXT_735901 [Caerostris extrusa]|uniref:Uncharacterized protein n=1 Tax=Caerostris extrusa TaxID=172846 RepID=A0AAV4Y3T0_CAEEX|nr:hypothetical protein CEXT_735901 [Caerostris extrusa]
MEIYAFKFLNIVSQTGTLADKKYNKAVDLRVLSLDSKGGVRYESFKCYNVVLFVPYFGITKKSNHDLQEIIILTSSDTRIFLLETKIFFERAFPFTPNNMSSHSPDMRTQSMHIDEQQLPKELSFPPSAAKIFDVGPLSK